LRCDADSVFELTLPVVRRARRARRARVAARGQLCAHHRVFATLSPMRWWRALFSMTISPTRPPKRPSTKSQQPAQGEDALSVGRATLLGDYPQLEPAHRGVWPPCVDAIQAATPQLAPKLISISSRARTMNRLAAVDGSPP